MGNIPLPTAHTQQPARMKSTKMQRKRTLMVCISNKFAAMKANFDTLPEQTLTEEMVALKAVIDKHFAAPELIEAFESVYAVHPEWEMPAWFEEKMGVQIDKNKQDTLVEGAENEAEGAV